MKKENVERLRLRLEQRRWELVSSNNRAREESREDVSGSGTLDYVDYAVHSYDKEFLLSLSSLERRELHQIEEALARMDSGDYGLCQECGEEISEKRLTAVPWARHCIECQELEEQGLLPSYHFEAMREPNPEDMGSSEEAGE
jgi:DnaK suppressor protein